MKIFKRILALILVLISIGLFAIGWSELKQRKDFYDNKDHIVESTGADIVEQLSAHYDPIFEKWSEVNDEFTAYLEWENNLLYDYTFESEDKFPHLVMYSEIDNKYMNTNIENEYQSFGQEFIDSSNTINNEGTCNDQNIIIYGHYVYRDESLKFSPLHKLKDSELFDEYNSFKLTFKNEQREYEVVKVFKYSYQNYKGKKSISPFATNYTEEDFEEYKKSLENFQTYIDTEDMNYDDKFVTLQTCIPYNQEEVLIVIGKEVNRIRF